MRKGLREVGLTLGGQVGALLAGIGTQGILAWTLGPEGCGSLAVCLLFATVLVLVFSVGCDLGALYFVSSKQFTISEGLFYTLLFGTVSSLVAMAIGWGLIRLPISFFSKAGRDAFLLSLLLVPASLFGDVFYRLLTAVRLFKHFAVITVLRSVLQLLLTICFVCILKWGIPGALLATIATAATVAVVCVAVFLLRFEVTWVRPSMGRIADMFSYGSRYYLGKASNMAKNQIGTIMLALFATREQIGWFALAARLINLVEMIPESLTMVLFPRVAADERGRKDLVVRTARVVAVACGGIFLLLSLFATLILRIVFSPDFLPTAPLIRILAVGGVAYCMAKVFLSYLVAAKHPGKASVAVMIGVAVNIGLLWWLLPRIGVAAAAWAMSANYVISSVILVLVFSRFSGTRLREMFSFSRNDWGEIMAVVRRFERKTTA